jgi:hypothetical protein
MATTSFPVCRFADAPDLPAHGNDSSPIQLPLTEAAWTFGDTLQSAVSDALAGDRPGEAEHDSNQVVWPATGWPYATPQIIEPFSWDPVLVADSGTADSEGSLATSHSPIGNQSLLPDFRGPNRSGKTSPDSSLAVSAGDLAFELRIDTPRDSSRASESEPEAILPARAQKATVSTQPERLRIEPIQAAGQVADLAAASTNWHAAAGSSESHEASAQLPAAVESAGEIRPDVELQPADAPVREIAWSVKTDGQSAHVRLMDRSGEVVVSVRTPNQELLQPLRSGLGDLLNQLQSDGFAVEASLPSSNAGDREADSGRGDSAWASRQTQHQASGERGRHPRQQTPMEMDDER